MERENKRGTRRPNHWIYLDRWWAKRLGVRRTAGVYRIRSRELVRRLSQERLGMDASGTVFAYGTRPVATRAGSAERLESEYEKITPQRRG